MKRHHWFAFASFAFFVAGFFILYAYFMMGLMEPAIEGRWAVGVSGMVAVGVSLWFFTSALRN